MIIGWFGFLVGVTYMCCMDYRLVVFVIAECLYFWLFVV